MTRKGRYGRFIKLIITTIDFLLINSVYVLVCLLFNVTSDFFNLKVAALLNISYLISIFLYSDVHSRRIFYADKIILREIKLVLLNIILFLSLFVIFIDETLDVYAYSLYLSISFVLLGIWWILSRKVAKFFRSHGLNFKRVIIIGRSGMGNKLIEEMLSDAGYGYRILGVFDDNENVPIEEAVEYVGKIDEVESFVKDKFVDEMYCALPGTEGNLMERLIRISEDNAVDFYYVPQVSPKLMRQFELSTLGNIPALSLRPNPLNQVWNKIIKRTFDIVFSSVFLILSPIIFLPVAIAIKITSPGPVFFKQKRTGYRGKNFTCYKFRTMKVNKDSDKLQTTKNDPRKTKLGNLLRKTSIDELPQFFNVWKGDMSIVGPRPHMLKHTKDYSALIDKYMVRHIIKPGITGWAQVNGYRGETKELWQMQKRVEYDVWYAENWNLMLDFKIIVKTVINAIVGEKNAF